MLLSAPPAFFGLALNGWVLIFICILLSVTAWITAIQRIAFVYRVTRDMPDESAHDARPSNHNGAARHTPAESATATTVSR